MKKLFLAISMMAAMIAVSCNKEETPGVNEEPEYIEVKIGMSGAISSDMVPLTKALAAGEIIGIGIKSCPEDGSKYTNYASGFFNTNENITVKLMKGYKYKITAESGKQNIFMKQTSSGSSSPVYDADVTNTFNYVQYPQPATISNTYKQGEFYYGQVNNYVPSENGVISIDMQSVSFGINITPENLADGETVKVTITGKTYSSYKLGEFNVTDTYQANYVMHDFGKAVTTPTYYEELTVSAQLVNSDNIQIPIGTTTIKVMMNKLTRIKINAAAPTEDNGFSLSYSDSDMTDMDESYNIGGSETTDTPIQ